MKASRAAIKTAKAVVSVEERLTAVEEELRKAGQVLKRLVTAVSALSADRQIDKPSGQGQVAPPRARTVRKRGGS